MERLAPIGRRLFGGALLAFGVEQFVVGDFVPGRALAWPASMPGRLFWAYLSGAILIAAGAAIITATRVRWAALLAGTMIIGWALLRHLPLAAADPSFGFAWTNMGKALALSGGALAVAGSAAGDDAAGGRASINAQSGLVVVGRCCLAAFLILAGIQHFLFAGFVKLLVPAWIPGALFWTYFAGVALIAGGAGLIVPRTARLAAALSGLMVFLWLLVLHIPRAIAAPPDQLRNEWTAVFEALAISGIAFVLAGVAGARDRRPAR